MSKTSRLCFLAFSICVSSVVLGASDEVEILVQPESDLEVEGVALELETPPVSEVSAGTKIYDAATVGELFQAYDEKNKRRAAEMAPHLNYDALDVIELAPVQVEANHIEKLRELSEKIDPQPLRRLQRLAELDPAAAADLRVTMRSEERFFAGEHDAIFDANVGRTANFDLGKVTDTLSAALKRAKPTAPSKKVTDDQQKMPTKE